MQACRLGFYKGNTLAVSRCDIGIFGGLYRRTGELIVVLFVAGIIPCFTEYSCSRSLVALAAQ